MRGGRYYEGARGMKLFSGERKVIDIVQHLQWLRPTNYQTRLRNWGKVGDFMQPNEAEPRSCDMDTRVHSPDEPFTVSLRQYRLNGNVRAFELCHSGTFSREFPPRTAVSSFMWLHSRPKLPWTQGGGHPYNGKLP
jgi:hypothetical protein